MNKYIFLCKAKTIVKKKKKGEKKNKIYCLG